MLGEWALWWSLQVETFQAETVIQRSDGLALYSFIKHKICPLGWSRQKNVRPSSSISMGNISRLHLEFKVSFLEFFFFVVFVFKFEAEQIVFIYSAYFSIKTTVLLKRFQKTECYLLFGKPLVQHRQNPCCVNLLMEARRSARARGNICRTVGPGQEMERL